MHVGARGGTARAVQRRFEPAPPDVKGATVLVVDDERAWRAILETDLNMLGYQVVTAADAGEALERAASARPALAIVDLMLPEPVDGRELVRRLRARGSTVPVVFYSARGTLEEDGPDAPAFFSKAANRADLYASLPDLIRRGALSNL